MRVLWDKGRANAREITDSLNERQTVAHSTVQTLLRKLEAKQAVSHDVVERTFVFFPLVEEHGVVRRATRDLIDRVFGGSAGGLLAWLVKEERISRKELEQVRKLIELKTPAEKRPDAKKSTPDSRRRT
jgi:BlaI family penicillinase repressor